MLQCFQKTRGEENLFPRESHVGSVFLRGESSPYPALTAVTFLLLHLQENKRLELMYFCRSETR